MASSCSSQEGSKTFAPSDPLASGEPIQAEASRASRRHRTWADDTPPEARRAVHVLLLTRIRFCPAAYRVSPSLPSSSFPADLTAEDMGLNEIANGGVEHRAQATSWRERILAATSDQYWCSSIAIWRPAHEATGLSKRVYASGEPKTRPTRSPP